MSAIFTNADVHEFIDLYKDEPVLWDPKAPNKRSRADVTDAWIRIQKAISVDCSVSDLKKKKECLMASFRLNAQRKKSERNFVPSWFAYDQMESFLGEKYECQNVKDEEESYSQSLDTYFEEINNTSGINLDAFEKKPSKMERKRKRRTKVSEDSIETTVISEDSDTKESCSKRVYVNDECEVYCQLLAMKLRKLNEHERDLTMHGIDNIMFCAKMKKSKEKIKSKLRNVKEPVFVAFDQDDQSYFENTQYEDHHLQSD